MRWSSLARYRRPARNASPEPWSPPEAMDAHRRPPAARCSTSAAASTSAELAALAALPADATGALADLAHEVRLAWCGDTVEVEGILSAKTGGCPEDCHFCAQSARFDTPVKPIPFLDPAEVVAAARETAKLGASEFCLVYAVRGPDARLMERILALVPVVQREGLQVAVSAGILTREQAERFAAGGVHRYNHNLETARSFFPRDRQHPQPGRSAGRPASS